MKETIKALFSGKLYPFENCNIQSEQFESVKKKLSEMRQELIKIINNDKLEEYDNLVSELNFYFCEHYFCQGFELGMKLAIETII